MSLEDEFIKKIKVLNEEIWESQAQMPVIEDWLANFSDSSAGPRGEQRTHALFLLSQFMYFGRREMRELLKALFRDKYKYPVVERIRKENNDTTNVDLINRLFLKELERTRFLGVGNPSESGTHLLYYFRQENGLSKELFINSHELFSRDPSTGAVSIRSPDVTRYVFLDDFCGSGLQAKTYSGDQLAQLDLAGSSAETAYYVLFATTSGLKKIRSETRFDRVEAIFELDDTYKCFESESRYFARAPKQIRLAFAELMCRHYGLALLPKHPLGFKDGQLLLGFYHNTPDNTLPVIWWSEPNSKWIPIFRRYPKLFHWSGI